MAIKPRYRSRYYYDPDPDPFPWTIFLFVGALALWSNPNMLNNIMFMLNPALREEEEQRQKEMQETIKWVMLLTCILSGLAFFIWWIERGRKR